MAYKLYHQLPNSSRETWLRKHGLVASRFKQFVTSADHLWELVRSLMSGRCNKSLLQSAAPAIIRDQKDYYRKDLLNDWQLNALRLLLVWTCDNNFLKMCKVKKSESSNSIDVLSPELNEVLHIYHFTYIFT